MHGFVATKIRSLCLGNGTCKRLLTRVYQVRLSYYRRRCLVCSAGGAGGDHLRCHGSRVGICGIVYLGPIDSLSGLLVPTPYN